MSNALRGDFERLRARGVATTFDATASSATGLADASTEIDVPNRSPLDPPAIAVTDGTVRRFRRFRRNRR